jgi:hypothetical protein
MCVNVRAQRVVADHSKYAVECVGVGPSDHRVVSVDWSGMIMVSPASSDPASCRAHRLARALRGATAAEAAKALGRYR